MKLTRRAMIGSTLALGACKQPARSQTIAPVAALAPLRTAPFPVGVCLQAGQLADPALASLLVSQFSQVTPEWEMKMEAVLKPDGTFGFTAADAIAAYAATNGLRLHGHTLIWYSQDGGEAFARVANGGESFRNAYRNYILGVAGRYRGRAAAWDVVNEPVAEDGEGFRDCIWRRNLGMDYVAHAFRHAQEADPGAVLFLNDYNLETNPKKRRTFLMLAEQVLKAGAPLGGLGTQTHLSVDVAPGAIKEAVRDLASLGLPIHISELDVSTTSTRLMQPDTLRINTQQAALVGEAVEAFMSLPPQQRYAITVWGVRDIDSWLRRAETRTAATERPLLFDDGGAPKPAASAFLKAAGR